MRISQREIRICTFQQTNDYESCQNEISALTTWVNGVDFALGQGGDVHFPMAHVNQHTDPV